MAGAASPAPTTQGASSETPSSNTEQNSSPGPGKVALRSKYVPRACLECRRRRVKCDGTKPTCSRCNTRQIPCVYNTDDEGRGIAQKSHVRLRLLQGRIALLEKVLWLYSINVHASTAQLMQQNLVPATITSLTVAQLLPWTDSVIRLRTLWPLISRKTLTRTERHVISARPVVDVASSRSMTSLILPQDVPRDLPMESLPPSADSSAQMLGEQRSVTGELEAHLLEQYFTRERPWLRVINKALFRESRENNGRYFTPLLLNCILASGSRFSDRVEVRSNPNDPNTAGRIFLKTAKILLYFDLKRPDIGRAFGCMDACAEISLQHVKDDAGYSAGQQQEVTTSDALTDHQNGGLYPTSEASQVTNLMQPADGVWAAQLADAMSLPLWLLATMGDPSLGEFSTATEGIPLQDGSTNTSEQNWDWLEAPFPRDLLPS
ncbi:C6 transcription factor, putative [Metarhizium acridum CQMa 102]|uniref:C6 transcription factor, putative n=1 Tax=Metarhizium acridum (strain CQMa 102) TaxID=655827 RepID=E9DZ51_METAQ|nr:C6 transcription factor, putative [Metarhizium acridum CQMa 102]EFY91013.1 C6 transcription factor, putative [Metarhizium acridum CQMa 102]